MKARYKVVFTPVGWQVVDTVKAGDPVAEYGMGDDEYARAKAYASMRSLDAQCDPEAAHSQESPS